MFAFLQIGWVRYLAVAIIAAFLAATATYKIMDMKVDKLKTELEAEQQKLKTAIEVNQQNVDKMKVQDKEQQTLKASYDKQLNYCWRTFNEFKKINEEKGGINANTGTDTLLEHLNSLHK